MPLMARVRARNGNGRRLTTQQSVNAAVKSICDIMRRSNCAGALQYVPELTWILFLRILDEREQREPLAGLGRSRRAEAPGPGRGHPRGHVLVRPRGAAALSQEARGQAGGDAA